MSEYYTQGDVGSTVLSTQKVIELIIEDDKDLSNRGVRDQLIFEGRSVTPKCLAVMCWRARVRLGIRRVRIEGT